VDYKGKGKAREVDYQRLEDDDFRRDFDGRGRSGRDHKRGRSVVSFSTSSSTIGEPSSRRIAETPLDPARPSLARRKSVPDQLQADDDWDDTSEEPSSSSSPHRNSQYEPHPRPSRTPRGKPLFDTARTIGDPHPPRGSFRAGSPARRDQVRTSSSLASDSSTSLRADSTAILAQARAALSNSAARTSNPSLSGKSKARRL